MQTVTESITNSKIIVYKYESISLSLLLNFHFILNEPNFTNTNSLIQKIN
jgi:hypothetical protein